jgi:hypothetical protein
MNTYKKLKLAGIALLIIPVIALAAQIAWQLSQMETPDAAHLNLRWAFTAFYAMAAGLVMLIFARGIKDQNKK